MTTPSISIHPTLHATDIVSQVEHRCPACQRMAWWWRNEYGRTLCVDCSYAEGARP